MSRLGELMAGRAEDFDAGAGRDHGLGEDQGDRGRSRVECGARRWVGLNQLGVGEGDLGDEGGGDRQGGDCQPPRSSQE